MPKSKSQRYFDIVEAIINEGIQRGINHLAWDDDSLNGRTISVNNHQVINFGSSSYLGLELDWRLINAASEAAHRFGTQYSSSRAYMSSAQYPELEYLMKEIFDQPVIVMPSTTLAHFSSIPVLVHDDNVIVLDQRVHASVQMAAQMVKGRGVPVMTIKHNRLDKLAQYIDSFGTKFSRIWYMIDGVYSMHGDRAPLSEILALMENHDKLHLYIDDAHSMSWSGRNGRGYTLDTVKQHERIMLITSLNKGFGAAGGAIVLPNLKWYREIRACGPSLTFCGPIQPPMLGAAIASAHIHLSDEIYQLQAGLNHRIEHCNKVIRQYNLPLVAESPTPIFFIKVGLPHVGANLTERLLKEGFFVNIGAFPATPFNETGIRFSVTLHHNLEDIDKLADAIARNLPKAIKDESAIRSAGRLIRSRKLTG
jgi:7-keto-8-aminopelargonate synthetase-like enzyme